MKCKQSDHDVAVCRMLQPLDGTTLATFITNNIVDVLGTSRDRHFPYHPGRSVVFASFNTTVVIHIYEIASLQILLYTLSHSPYSEISNYAISISASDHTNR